MADLTKQQEQERDDVRQWGTDILALHPPGVIAQPKFLFHMFKVETRDNNVVSTVSSHGIGMRDSLEYKPDYAEFSQVFENFFQKNEVFFKIGWDEYDKIGRNHVDTAIENWSLDTLTVHTKNANQATQHAILNNTLPSYSVILVGFPDVDTAILGHPALSPYSKRVDFNELAGIKACL